jgi:hypothetical protein
VVFFSSSSYRQFTGRLARRWNGLRRSELGKLSVVLLLGNFGDPGSMPLLLRNLCGPSFGDWRSMMLLQLRIFCIGIRLSCELLLFPVVCLLHGLSYDNLLFALVCLPLFGEVGSSLVCLLQVGLCGELKLPALRVSATVLSQLARRSIRGASPASQSTSARASAAATPPPMRPNGKIGAIVRDGVQEETSTCVPLSGLAGSCMLSGLG